MVMAMGVERWCWAVGVWEWRDERVEMGQDDRFLRELGVGILLNATCMRGLVTGWLAGWLGVLFSLVACVVSDLAMGNAACLHLHACSDAFPSRGSRRD